MKLQKPADELNELDQYVFIVRVRMVRIAVHASATSTYSKTLDKEIKDFIFYVDIISEGLRDILRTVLRDMNIICLREDKPIVQSSLVSIKDVGFSSYADLSPD